MKIHLILIGLVMSLPLVEADKKPLTKEESAKAIEAAIRKSLKKPTGTGLNELSVTRII